ncbi:hypothetical protein E0H75_07085 [Kribbella capetownensis]|uniref:Uncharacterized protein n=1 Tax=Kribbella capetownensis TaxID=1572659 RepID=A0A4R0K6E6_9ACTN|nr:hypothetical protein [Kribbella capetownensis]TCC53448.1 hypothetical protein E0H75_07085 [Kribbella capetownensis]
MADQERVRNLMAKLMPLIRAAFADRFAATSLKSGAKAPPKLRSLLRVELRESALSVRLPDPEWPDPDDALVKPKGTPVTALRLCREMTLKVLDRQQQQIMDDVEQFGESTAEVYRKVVLDALLDAATRHAPGRPDAQELSTRATNLGVPCRVVAGSKLGLTAKDIGPSCVDGEVEVEADWPDERALVLSLRANGPWVEELDPEFVVEWEHAAAAGSVRLLASRRLYLNKPEKCYLYMP